MTKNVRYVLLATTMLSMVSAANVAMADGTGKAYVRLDGGYSFSDFDKSYGKTTKDAAGKDVANTIKLKSGNSPTVALGVGYIFTENVRGDITLQYTPGYDTSATFAQDNHKDFENVGYTAGNYPSAIAGGVPVDVVAAKTNASLHAKKTKAFKIRSLVTMANVYYDFTQFGSIVPYVGAGVGVANLKTADQKTVYTGQQEIAGTIPNGTGTSPAVGLVPLSHTETVKGGSTNNFAYSAIVGAGFPVGEGFVVDTSYRYTSLGKAKLAKGSDSLKTKTLRNHEIMVGVRYEF